MFLCALKLFRFNNKAMLSVGACTALKENTTNVFRALKFIVSEMLKQYTTVM